uniref:alpha-amylase n=1 Tax=Sinocyclocheilus rhinocerous TaxID=307959 RepID=A0A673LHU1_9TELE
MKLLILAALSLARLAQFNANTRNGRTAIVHLFGADMADIAAECERYLGPDGFGGVQISPPSESIVVTNPWHPWWQRYHPIGYNLCSRSGNENELRDMITRCNNVGVNIYVDAIINHMCGAGGGAGTHSSCGSYFDANKKDFPTVPYSNLDFNDGKCNTGNEIIGKVASFMNKLIDMGVAGFIVDACKHMWPGDLSAVYGRLNNLNTKWFPSGARPFIFQEVIDLGGEPITSGEYTGIGRVTEFKYGAKLGNVIRKWNGEKLSFVKNWGEGWGFMSSDKALVFVDNHDNQRGHGAGGASIVTFWDARLYKMAVAFMLAHPYGFTRVMSSYRWDRNIVNGQDQNYWQNMVAFRNVVNGKAFSNWWDNGSNQISFSRLWHQDLIYEHPVSWASVEFGSSCFNYDLDQILNCLIRSDTLHCCHSM